MLTTTVFIVPLPSETSIETDDEPLWKDSGEAITSEPRVRLTFSIQHLKPGSAAIGRISVYWSAADMK